MNIIVCPACKGIGVIEERDPNDRSDTIFAPCTECETTGRVYEYEPHPITTSYTREGLEKIRAVQEAIIKLTREM